MESNTKDLSAQDLPDHANPIVLQWLKEGKLKVTESGCWEWQLGKSGGYGRVGKGRAHRIAINCPKDLHSLHSCDNPPCCNPWHLRAGTDAENKADYKERQLPREEERRSGKFSDGRSFWTMEDFEHKSFSVEIVETRTFKTQEELNEFLRMEGR